MEYIKELSSQQILQALENSQEEWGKSRPLEDLHQKVMSLVNFDGPPVLLMKGFMSDNGQIVSSLKRYQFSLSTPEGIIPCAGLGAIFTRIEERSKGIASQLIKKVLDEARAEGFGASLLFSDIGAEYYQKFGFEALPDLSWRADVKKLLGAEFLRVRSATPSDTEQLIQWYESSFPQGFLRIIRNDKTWNFFRLRTPPSEELVFFDDEQDVAYASLSFGDNLLWVEEIGVAKTGLENRIWATIANLAQQKGLQLVGSWLRPDAVPDGFVGISREKALPMVLSFANASIVPEFESQIHFESLDHF